MCFAVWRKKTFSYITFILFLASIIIFVFSIVKSRSYALLNFLVNPFVCGHYLVRFVATTYKGDLSKKFLGRIKYWQHVKTICDDFSSNYMKYLKLHLIMIAQPCFGIIPTILWDYIDYPPGLSISSPHSLISCQFLHIWLRTWQHANLISKYNFDTLQISILDLNTKCNNLFDYYSFELYKPRNLDITWKLNYEWLISKYWF